MRAKAPPEIEFVEILQKFKLSFNMLVRRHAILSPKLNLEGSPVLLFYYFIVIYNGVGVININFYYER